MPEFLQHNFDQIDLAVQLGYELAELRRSVEGHRAATGATVAQARFERWKERSAEAIRRTISDVTASEFTSLPAKPRATHSETLLDLFELHHAFLIALAEDIGNRPGAFPDPATQGRRFLRSSKPPSLSPPRSRLPDPEKVTLEWLRIHVPLRYWIAVALGLFGLVSGAFVAGVRLGQNDTFVRSFAPFLRVNDSSAPIAEHPPASSRQE